MGQQLDFNDEEQATTQVEAMLHLTIGMVQSVLGQVEAGDITENEGDHAAGGMLALNIVLAKELFGVAPRLTRMAQDIYLDMLSLVRAAREDERETAERRETEGN